MTKIYMLDTSEIILYRGEDFALVLFLLLTPIAYIRKNSIFSWKQDKIAKWIYIFIIYYVFEFIITVVSGAETIVNSIKVIRYPLFIYSFFIFRIIPLIVYKKFFRVAFYITLFQSILFLLQILGIRLIVGSEIAEASISEMGFFAAFNIPTFTMFFLFLSLYSGQKDKYRYITFLYLALIVLLTFSRGLIISLYIGIVYVLIRRVKRKKIVPFLLVAFPLFFVIAFFFNMKTKGSNVDSASTQVVQIVKNKNDLATIDYSSGTMVFRLAMLAERFNYLMDNPRYVLTGVGTMHEDSPHTASQFDFKIGTVNEGRDRGYCMIESGDITWVPIVLRYGLLGVALHLYMLCLIVREAKKHRDDLFVIAPLYISVAICSFDSSLFENVEKVYLMSLYFSMLSRARINIKQFRVYKV